MINFLIPYPAAIAKGMTANPVAAIPPIKGIARASIAALLNIPVVAPTYAKPSEPAAVPTPVPPTVVATSRCSFFYLIFEFLPSFYFLFAFLFVY